ncbi:hypothetical protein, partial [Longimicrobium sp.]|uniref:hypothetical protein n=1 Tax=Longimicrobium sp. TaxID=2029185 RepID=UPI002BFE19EB
MFVYISIPLIANSGSIVQSGSARATSLIDPSACKRSCGGTDGVAGLKKVPGAQPITGDFNAWWESPSDQVGELECWPVMLAVEPDEYVVQRDLGGQARLESLDSVR